MDSIVLIRDNLRRSEEIVLSRIEEMEEHCLVFPSDAGGCHTLWLVGHLAYIEALVLETFVRGRDNPLSHWESMFDASDVSSRAEDYVSFDEALRQCRSRRRETLQFLAQQSKDDLDRPSRRPPDGAEQLFGNVRICLQYCADHWWMHRGQLAVARRAAGVGRMWY
ncbi:MAG: DinB family protein [Planctomycetota bacterium]